MGAPGAVWEVSWEPLEPSGTRLGSSWQRFADMLNFTVFSMVFIVFSMFLRDFTGVGSHRRAKLTQVEVHKAYVEAHEAYVEAHKAHVEAHKAHVEVHKGYVEVHKAHVEVHRPAATHKNSRNPSNGKSSYRVSVHTWISTS